METVYGVPMNVMAMMIVLMGVTKTIVHQVSLTVLLYDIVYYSGSFNDGLIGTHPLYRAISE